MTVVDLLLILPERGWGVVRDVPPSTLMFATMFDLVKAHRAGPGEKVYEVRLTGKGRAARKDLM
jgi:hypothetical protein